MSEGSSTLRSLGESASTAFQSLEASAQATAATLQNNEVVDWPLWIFGVGALVALFSVGPITAIVREVLSATREGASAIFRLGKPSYPIGSISEPEDARLRRESRGPYSADRRERLRWSNREGEFTPDAKVD